MGREGSIESQQKSDFFCSESLPNKVTNIFEKVFFTENCQIVRSPPSDIEHLVQLLMLPIGMIP